MAKLYWRYKTKDWQLRLSNNNNKNYNNNYNHNNIFFLIIIFKTKHNFYQLNFLCFFYHTKQESIAACCIEKKKIEKHRNLSYNVKTVKIHAITSTNSNLWQQQQIATYTWVTLKKKTDTACSQGMSSIILMAVKFFFSFEKPQIRRETFENC